MTATPEPPAQPAPLFSAEAVESAIEAVRVALRRIRVEDGNRKRVKVTGLANALAPFAVHAALAAPGVRREVERIATAAFARGLRDSLTDDHEVCETDRARLAAALEAAERGWLMAWEEVHEEFCGTPDCEGRSEGCSRPIPAALSGAGERAAGVPDA